MLEILVECWKTAWNSVSDFLSLTRVAGELDKYSGDIWDLCEPRQWNSGTGKRKHGGQLAAVSDDEFQLALHPRKTTVKILHTRFMDWPDNQNTINNTTWCQFCQFRKVKPMLLAIPEGLHNTEIYLNRLHSYMYNCTWDFNRRCKKNIQ